MNSRNRAAQILVALGCLVLLVSTVAHCAGAYPHLSRELAASNLPVPLQNALRAIFFLTGWDWIVIAVVALLAAFTRTKLRRALVLFCALALWVETGLTLAFIGVFPGNELIGSAAVLILCAGLLFQNPHPA
jgi:hypothetical protein